MLDYKTGKTKLEEIAVGDVIYIRPYSGTYLAFTIEKVSPILPF